MNREIRIRSYEGGGISSFDELSAAKINLPRSEFQFSIFTSVQHEGKIRRQEKKREPSVKGKTLLQFGRFLESPHLLFTGKRFFNPKDLKPSKPRDLVRARNYVEAITKGLLVPFINRVSRLDRKTNSSSTTDACCWSQLLANEAN